MILTCQLSNYKMLEKTGDGSEKKFMQHLFVDATLGPYIFLSNEIHTHIQMLSGVVVLYVRVCKYCMT